MQREALTTDKWPQQKLDIHAAPPRRIHRMHHAALPNDSSQLPENSQSHCWRHPHPHYHKASKSSLLNNPQELRMLLENVSNTTDNRLLAQLNLLGVKIKNKRKGKISLQKCAIGLNLKRRYKKSLKKQKRKHRPVHCWLKVGYRTRILDKRHLIWTLDWVNSVSARSTTPITKKLGTNEYMHSSRRKFL